MWMSLSSLFPSVSLSPLPANGCQSINQSSIDLASIYLLVMHIFILIYLNNKRDILGILRKVTR